ADGGMGCPDDLTKSPNCGACGAICPGSTPCAQTPAGTFACGCSATTLTPCSGSCVDLQTDGNNCGRCGHGCQGGMCSAGQCQPVVFASGQNRPSNIAADATNVYWTDGRTNPGLVMKCAVGGCSQPTVFASGPLFPEDIALDSEGVYWTTSSSSPSVMACPLG